MREVWPRTLFGRIALLMLAAPGVAHLLTFGSILRERGELTRSMMNAYLGRDVATAVAVLDRLPPVERAAWLPRLARQNYGYTLQAAAAEAAATTTTTTTTTTSAAATATNVVTPAAPPAVPDDSALARQLVAAIGSEVGASRVGMPLRHAEDGALQLPLRLADGGQLTLHLRPPTAWVSTGTALLLGLQLLLAAVSHDLQTPITRLRLRAEQVSGQLDAPLITRVQALRRLLTHLIDNALKFGGAAQVHLRTEAGRLRITVLDHGPGIPEAELTRVLAPFYRVDSSRSRDTGGTGLGLAIAHQLAMALGGELTLHNRAEGGLEARLMLPLATPARTITR